MSVYVGSDKEDSCLGQNMVDIAYSLFSESNRMRDSGFPWFPHGMGCETGLSPVAS